MNEEKRDGRRQVYVKSTLIARYDSITPDVLIAKIEAFRLALPPEVRDAAHIEIDGLDNGDAIGLTINAIRSETDEEMEARLKKQAARRELLAKSDRNKRARLEREERQEYERLKAKYEAEDQRALATEVLRDEEPVLRELAKR